MPFMELLAEKASKMVDDKSEQWFDKLLDEGNKVVKKNEATKEDPKGLSAEEVKAATEALQLLRDNKQPFLRLGKATFASLVAHWEKKDEATARRIYLSTQATFQERRKAMHAATDAVAQDMAEREAAWKQVKGVLLKIGAIGLKLLITSLMAGL